jgi:tetratricopeptide (TPR) repeat protein
MLARGEADLDRLGFKASSWENEVVRMTRKGKQHGEGPEPATASPTLAELAQMSQIDFELSFFDGILRRHPDFVDVLRVLGNNLTLKGRVKDGLEIDRRLVRLRPKDPLAHYNLACSYALLKRTDPALKALRRAIELGYRDFRYMSQDHDLDSIRHDPRYRQLLREFRQR